MTSSITGVSIGRAGGGSGVGWSGFANAVDGGGGLIGGVPTSAIANTGGGGINGGSTYSGNGASGIIIIRYAMP
jgi:hypothetical protein